METNEPKTQLTRAMSLLVNNSLNVSGSIQMLHLMQGKIEDRAFHTDDKQDIYAEMGRLQGILNQLHGNLVQMDNVLKKM